MGPRLRHTKATWTTGGLNCPCLLRVWIWVPEGEDIPVGAIVPHEALLPHADVATFSVLRLVS